MWQFVITIDMQAFGKRGSWVTLNETSLYELLQASDGLETKSPNVLVHRTDTPLSVSWLNSRG